MRYDYHIGLKSYEKAQVALEVGLQLGEISYAEKPLIEMYYVSSKTNIQCKRYRITLCDNYDN